MFASLFKNRAATLVLAVCVSGSGLVPQGSGFCSAEEAKSARKGCDCSNESQPALPVPSDPRRSNRLMELVVSSLLVSATPIHSTVVAVDQTGTLRPTVFPGMGHCPLRVLHCLWLI